jgi:catechol 2,3-dioxygenase-like lactoylglutathione lyase family enzyme
MNIRRVVPNIETVRIAEVRDFYVEALGFEVAMDLGWIVTLASPSNPTAQIQLLGHDATAPMVPALSVEVADVDAAHRAAVERGLEIEHPLTDEPWGVRRFFVRDPSGTVVNVVSHRPGGTG